MNINIPDIQMPSLNVTDKLLAIEIAKFYLKNNLSEKDCNDLETLTKSFNDTFLKVCNSLEKLDNVN